MLKEWLPHSSQLKLHRLPFKCRHKCWNVCGHSVGWIWFSWNLILCELRTAQASKETLYTLVHHQISTGWVMLESTGSLKMSFMWQPFFDSSSRQTVHVAVKPPGTPTSGVSGSSEWNFEENSTDLSSKHTTALDVACTKQGMGQENPAI